MLHKQAPIRQAQGDILSAQGDMCCSVHSLVSLGVWTEKEKQIYEAIENGFADQFFTSYEDKVKQTLNIISKLDISEKNATKYIVSAIETELGVKFTDSQKRNFINAIRDAWKAGAVSQDIHPDQPRRPLLDFNAETKAFFQKSFKVDIGGQFKNNKNDFLSTIEEAISTGDIGTAVKTLEEKLLGKRTAAGKLDFNSELRNKLDYVVRDNIYRARNYSRSLRMEQEGITRVEIVAILDNRTSEICKALNGKSVELKTINSYITTFLADDPESPDFWKDRKNPIDSAVRNLGFNKMTGDKILEHLGHKAPPFHIRCRTTIVESISLTARTVKEAENIAKLQFGVTADYGDNLQLANHTNNALRQAREVGMKLPDKVSVSQDFFTKKYPTDYEATYAEMIIPMNDKGESIGQTEMFLRPDPYWDNPEVTAALMKDLGFASTARPDHTLLHEVSHLEHYENNKDTFLSYQNISLTKFQDIIFRNLGEKATKNPYEFVAEYGVAKIDNITIPESDKKILDDLYKALGGSR